MAGVIRGWLDFPRIIAIIIAFLRSAIQNCIVGGEGVGCKLGLNCIGKAIMSEILNKLTALASLVFRERVKESGVSLDRDGGFLSQHSDSQAAVWFSPSCRPSDRATTPILKLIFSDQEFASIVPREGKNEPNLSYPIGSFRYSPTKLIEELFESALFRMYCQRLPHKEDAFVKTVLDGFEEFRCAIKGEKVPIHTFTGLAGISLPEGTEITTPWGVIRPVPVLSCVPSFLQGFQLVLKTRCVLTASRLTSVRFHTQPVAEHTFDKADTEAIRSKRWFDLLPLACALTLKDDRYPVAPIVTWATSRFSFTGERSGELFPLPAIQAATKGPECFVSVGFKDLEEWSEIVENAHVPSIDKQCVGLFPLLLIGLIEMTLSSMQ